MDKGHQFFDNMRHNWENRSHRSGRDNQQTNDYNYRTNTSSSQQTQRTENDWDYNARKKKEQEEIDSILDKIRKSGYDSLTKDEKQKLFDSNKQ